MSTLSTLANSMRGSEIVQLGNMISRQIHDGAHIYNFTIGDFDPAIFPLPRQLEDNILSAYRAHQTNYPPAEGIPALREAVTDYLSELPGMDYAPEEIQIASGGRPLIYTAFRTLVDPEDHVVYAVPSWNNNHYTFLHQGRHVLIETHRDNNFMPTADDLAPHLSGAVLLCLCTPQNPTGTTLSRDELAKICALILEENRSRKENQKKLYLLFDQMYWQLTYADIVHYTPLGLYPEMKKYTIFIDGVSKAFAGTGLRVGWSAGPESVIRKMKAFLTHIGAWAPLAEQYAVASFLRDSTAMRLFLSSFRESLRERLHQIYEGFQRLKKKGFPIDAIAPQAAIYLTVQIDLTGWKTAYGTLDTQEKVTEYLLMEGKLALVPFSCFGAPETSSWYRLSVGNCHMEEIQNVFSQLESALNRLSR